MEIHQLSKMPTAKRVSVGAGHQNNASASRKTQRPEYGVSDFATARRHLISEAPTWGENAFRELTDTQLARDQLNEGIRCNIRSVAQARKAKPEMTIHAKLDPLRMRNVKEVLADYDLTFTDSDANDHCFARAATAAATRLMDDQVLHVSTLKSNSEGIKLKEIGSNPLKYVKRGDMSVHHCISFTESGDSRDIARRGQLQAELLTTEITGRAHEAIPLRVSLANVLQGKPGDSYCCGKLGQNCDYKCPTIRLCNVHDISPRQVALAMARSEAVEAAGVLMYNPMIFVPGLKGGKLPFSNFVFRKYTIGNTEKISFRGPNGDAQEEYVHNWETYSSWIYKRGIIKVLHNGREHAYVLTAHKAVLDMLIWKMFPAPKAWNVVDEEMTMTIPAISCSPFITLVGYWYKCDNPDVTLIAKPKSKDFMILKAESVPFELLDQVDRILMTQKNNFTTTFTLEAFVYQVQKELEGKRICDQAGIDAKTLAFIAATGYNGIFSLRYEFTKTSAVMNRETEKYRDRINRPLLSRVLRSLRRSHEAVRTGLEISGPDGVKTPIAVNRKRFISRQIRKIERENHSLMKYKGLVLSSNHLLSYGKNTKSSAMLHFSLERIGETDESDMQIDESIGPFEEKHVILNNELKEIPMMKTYDNSCAIDAFVAAYQYETQKDTSFFEVARKVINSPALPMLPDCADVNRSLMNDSCVSRNIYHVIAHEYKVRILLKYDDRTVVYGESNVDLFLRFVCSDHIVPCTVVDSAFPSLLKYYDEREPEDEDIAFAESIAHWRKDTENSGRYGEHYTVLECLDSIFKDQTPKKVLDVQATFCDNALIRNSFNWSYHCGRPVKAKSVASFYGVTAALIDRDPKFWNNARQDKTFRFDLILQDLRDNKRGDVFSMTSPLKTTGLHAVLVNANNCDDTMLSLEFLARTHGCIDVYKPRNNSMLNDTIMIIFRNKEAPAVGIEILHAKIKEVRSMIRKFAHYINNARSYDVKNIEDIVEQQLNECKPYHFASTIDENFVREYCFNAAPRDTMLVLKTCSLIPEVESKLNKEFDDGSLSVKELYRRCRACLTGEKVVPKCIRNASKYQLSIFAKPNDSPDKMLAELVESLNKTIEKQEERERLIMAQISACNAQENNEINEIDRETVVSEHEVITEGEADAEPPEPFAIADDDDENVEVESAILASESSSDDDEVVKDTDSMATDHVIVEEKPTTDITEASTQIITRPDDEISAIAKASMEEFISYHRDMQERVILASREKAAYFSSFTRESIKAALANGEKDMMAIVGKTIYQADHSTISQDYSHVYHYDTGAIMTRSAFDSLSLKEQNGIVIPEFDPYISDVMVNKCAIFAKNVPKNVNIITEQAAAGSGKTYKIVENFDPHNDVVITPTKKSAEMTAIRIMNKHECFQRYRDEFKTIQPKERQDWLKKKIPVRTMYSFLIAPKGCNRLWIDEMTMHHRGAIYLAAIKSAAKEVICMGDAAQTFVFSKLPGRDFEKHKITDVYPPTKVNNTTYRCSIIVTALADIFYQKTDVLKGEKFVTKRRDKGKVSLERFDLPSVVTTVARSIERNKTVAVLSYTRNDKSTVEKVFKGKKIKPTYINTITEFQGSEADIVILVRSNASKSATGLYTRNDQLLTAATRARDEFHYYTRTSYDTMSNAIKEVRKRY